eukprot:1260554-Pyramimonas_sp.AAC.1
MDCSHEKYHKIWKTPVSTLQQWGDWEDRPLLSALSFQTKGDRVVSNPPLAYPAQFHGGKALEQETEKTRPVTMEASPPW